ncbi:cob(I)yrinic acid a,c-diamide adenosyltransferase [Oceanobacillus neutriphilus]|uniref:Corrinoid adenosyltransferase n=1 Tax=Oceanobacillus neutriphilus TaxID=531815 RepID=A0ABQ2P138_9BACI|nr:cob(I)yrinic acid a,c-diamide adenosyltransferase [Oceanobacillus neutriphilus]GGP15242.1 Cob(I)yrinic acid a,c-diamide adenosyltransferase [Oceanobacillus neutriphilus]
MRLYTRTGDKGQTALIGGKARKDDVRVEAYGSIDEINSFTGLAIAYLDPDVFEDIIQDLVKIQHELFDCGTELSNVSKKERPYELTEDIVTYLEERMDSLIEEAPELERFILPGGSQAASALHVARTVTRRAERQMVTLYHEAEEINPIPLKYINRLSDYFFAAARVVNARLEVADVEYERSARVFRGSHKKNK